MPTQTFYNKSFINHPVLFFLFGVFSCFLGHSQTDTSTFSIVESAEDTIEYERFIDNVEGSLFEYYKETWGKEHAYAVIDSLGYEKNDRPQISDSLLIARLNTLNSQTPFEIETNPDLIRVVRYFINKRRRFTAISLGRSKLYFPMFEEYLAKYDLPLELKYLAVIESGLRPTAGSRAGAVGLWQFMYRTGRSRGLHVDSYVDERMHPEKATDAACRYLKQLYGLYGDWSLALASYNAGPGNINKAIRRSGGKMNYWEIRPFMPKETQMYVPNFISMMYMMTYYAEHNIVPKEPKVYYHNYEVDTVCLKKAVRISHFDSILQIPEDEFRHLNPLYKTDIIPETEPKQCIVLPLNKMQQFLEYEDSLYGYQQHLDTTAMRLVVLEKKKYHYVKPGETLGQIAMKYDVTVTDIKKWNGMKYSKVYPEQKLTILLPEKQYVAATSSTKSTVKSSHSSSHSSTKTSSDGKYKYYSLKSGESLWTVSQKLGIPFARLQELNKGLDPKRMQPGDKIIIGVE
ncbi:MAG: transglycosylase SLT domain-containing protein [Putridiphycobacter sp.]